MMAFSASDNRFDNREGISMQKRALEPVYSGEGVVESAIPLAREINKAKDYIAENFSKKLTLGIVSAQIAVSPTYFCTVFKKSVGLSFVQYLHLVRLQNARLLLRNSNYSIRQISEMTGYCDPAYFRSMFFASYGILPSEYRSGAISKYPRQKTKHK